MKKIKLWIAIIIVSVALIGCEKKTHIEFAFSLLDVDNVEMYTYTKFEDAQKQIVTETEDIEHLYDLFTTITVSNKKTKPVEGKPITSFRFHLKDGTSYELIYCAEAVGKGRILVPSEQMNGFTSSDIGGQWYNFDYEIMPAMKEELPKFE